MNLGLYKKAELSFKEFLKTVFDDKNFLSEEMKEEMIKEANQNIHRLKIPIKIEEAENDIRTGNFKKARPVIEKYIIEEEFKNHWVLYLDLGIIYNEIYMENEAIEILEEGLKLKPQSVDIINLLITIYKKLNDDEMISKYSKKLELIQRGEL
ncbi:MAG: hypothetical protein LBD41_05760 [Clostridiales Family XIII bacterium]|nr:hypothetical protein [Clostridiales Family XIII bacterium]